jgi:Rap1a immunity proteins
MRKQHAIGIAAVVAFLAQPGSAATQFSAKDVMPGCRELADQTSKNVVLQAYCRGVLQVLLSSGGLVGICGANEVSNARAARVVTLYIDQRLARMHEDFTVLALEALQQAWPCRR